MALKTYMLCNYQTSLLFKGLNRSLPLANVCTMFNFPMDNDGCVHLIHHCLQEIRNSGAIGYKYITVDEDEAANVIYANNVLLHLANEQIPRGSAVSDAL